ncbi:MAG: hypothetical protein M3Y74_03865 [Chloroflexota bacterium]|nr:hypothetical protein [Chloroflexota bacterium]
MRVGGEGHAAGAAPRQRVPLGLCGARQAELILETIRRERGRPDDLREQALALTALQVHLEKTETRVQVSDGPE